MKQTALFFSILLVFQTGISAQADDSSLQMNFQGWNGIATSCEGSDEPRDQDLCSAIAKEAEYLARAGKVPFAHIGFKATYPDRVKAASEAGLKNALQIKIFLATNQDDTSIYGEITAGDYYQDAVSKTSQSVKDERKAKVRRASSMEKRVFIFGKS